MGFLENLLAKLGEFCATTGVRILAAVLLLVVGIVLTKWVLKLVRNGKGFQKLSPNAQTLINNILMIVLYAAIIAIAVAIIGVNAMVVSALILVCGLALALALKNSLANFAGSFMLLIFRPFSIGDYIDDGTNSGTVKDIGIFYTTIETCDNAVITVPNGKLANASVTDYSKKDVRRLDMKIEVAQNADIDLVKKTLLDLANAHELVLKDPASFARLSEQTKNTLVFDFRIWVKASDYTTVKYDMIEFTKKIFEKRGIAMPSSIMEVKVHNTNSNS